MENPNGFKERIKNDKIYSFATQSEKRKIGVAEGEIVEATLVKDLFGLILCLSVQQKINIAEFLKSPFTSAPLCLIHIDGSVSL